VDSTVLRRSYGGPVHFEMLLCEIAGGQVVLRPACLLSPQVSATDTSHLSLLDAVVRTESSFCRQVCQWGAGGKGGNAVMQTPRNRAIPVNTCTQQRSLYCTQRRCCTWNAVPPCQTAADVAGEHLTLPTGGSINVMPFHQQITKNNESDARSKKPSSSGAHLVPIGE